MTLRPLRDVKIEVSPFTNPVRLNWVTLHNRRDNSRITVASVYVSLSTRYRVYPRQYSFPSPLHHLTITYRRTTVKQVIPQLFAFLFRNFLLFYSATLEIRLSDTTILYLSMLQH